MEGPLPPLTKIDDEVEGVEVEVMLALKSMRRTRLTVYRALLHVSHAFCMCGVARNGPRVCF